MAESVPGLQVLLGRWQLSQVAVKVLKEECTQHISSNQIANLRRETEMLQALNHPNILRFYGACLTCQPVRTGQWFKYTLFDEYQVRFCILSLLYHENEYAGWLCADDTRQRGAKCPYCTHHHAVWMHACFCCMQPGSTSYDI